MSTRGLAHPALPGAVCALIAALLFGASTPFLQRAGTEVGSWMTAALLYLGASAAGLMLKTHRRREAPLRGRHWRRLLLVSSLGAVAAPALLAWGLQRTGAMAASLMLSLEAVFTVVLAALAFGERVDRRVGAAIILMTLGGALLAVDRADRGSTELAGILAVLMATACWAVDNTLSRPLAQFDPGRVVLAKSSLGAAASLSLAMITVSAHAPLQDALALFVIGFCGYGLSLRFYLLAQRSFGAARTGSVFSAAPFIGAAIAYALGDRAMGSGLVVGAALMMLGVVLHLLEQHDHDHAHEALVHEHAHVHDDGHHEHEHDGVVNGPHSHWHEHGAVRHSHPHTPDIHHGHPH